MTPFVRGGRSITFGEPIASDLQRLHDALAVDGNEPFTAVTAAALRGPSDQEATRWAESVAEYVRRYG